MQKRKVKAPQKLDEQNNTGVQLSPAEELKRAYVEAIDSVTGSLTTRYDQPGFKTFTMIESLLAKVVEEKSFATEMAYLSPSTLR